VAQVKTRPLNSAPLPFYSPPIPNNHTLTSVPWYYNVCFVSYICNANFFFGRVLSYSFQHWSGHTMVKLIVFLLEYMCMGFERLTDVACCL